MGCPLTRKRKQKKSPITKGHQLTGCVNTQFDWEVKHCALTRASFSRGLTILWSLVFYSAPCCPFQKSQAQHIGKYYSISQQDWENVISWSQLYSQCKRCARSSHPRFSNMSPRLLRQWRHSVISFIDGCSVPAENVELNFTKMNIAFGVVQHSVLLM